MPLVSLIRRALAGLLLAVFAAGAGGARAGEPPPVAIAVEHTAEAGRARLVFTLSQAVTATSFLMERPDRVVIELPEVNFQIPPPGPAPRQSLISSFRYGLFGSGRSRIVIDLDRPALVSKLAVTRRAVDGASLLAIELARTDRETFHRTVLADAGAALSASRAAVTGTLPDNPADRRPVVAIDAGHGGIDPGASAPSGMYEKDIVFAFARNLKARLEKTGRYRILMTRDADVFIPLGERVRMARNVKADLFVSIHADTIRSGQVSGLTVYTGSERASDDEAASLADRENQADAVAGAEGGETADDVADILRELTLRETRGFSHRIASRLVSSLDGVARLNKNPHRQAAFRVLRAPDIPSVLVELGYLSSKKDFDLLTSDEWRDKATLAMTEAIERYFANRLAGGQAAPVSP